MALISTHALDTSVGRPAAGVAVRLELAAGDGWIEVARAVTDDQRQNISYYIYQRM